METATLSTPQRKLNVVPIQKSLSLPSYARAGGEGIDHKLIFAALEQKERVRRKSKIFSREKTARQNLFCLPLPTGHKCKETSLSSDTSCSSLEYQKPKPAKKHDIKSSENEKPFKVIESKPILKPLKSNNLAQNAHMELKPYTQTDHRSPIDNLKPNVGSSDSMERSSRSSTDSFSRKERLVAIKARVEAAREMYGDSSSEEECQSTLTRYNSDGSIHKSGREYKSRFSRQERRLRRRSQDEFAIKKNLVKNDLNMNWKSGSEGIHLTLENTSVFKNEISNFDIKTDFCPSPNFPDLAKKNYFSDFPSRENSSRFVQARIRHLENEERMRRSGSDLRDKIRTPPRQSLQNLDNSSSASIEPRYQYEKQNGSNCSTLEKYPTVTDRTASSSPIPRSPQAPTPPPRSPKSKTFMNKTFIHHQNVPLLNQESCVERIKGFQPKTIISHDHAFSQFKAQPSILTTSPKTTSPIISTLTEKQNIRDLIANRRKTCGNFDLIDMNLLDDLIATTTNSLLNAKKKFSSVSQIKKNDESLSGTESSCVPSEGDFRSKLWKSKWQENEQRREYMFNSLETKKKSNPPLKWGSSPLKSDACICLLFPKDNFKCPCKSEFKQNGTDREDTDTMCKTETLSHINIKNVPSVLQSKTQSSKQDKSDSNTICNEHLISPFKEVKRDRHLLSQIFEDTLASKRNRKYELPDKHSATANLESAMEELESVYRSLKISNDNLLGSNSVANDSIVGDINSVSKDIFKDCSEKGNLESKRKSVICEGTFTSESPKTNFNTDKDKTNIMKTEKNFSSNKSDNYVSETSNETFSVNQLSIDELFNGLTQQLDMMEQNLLKEPKVNKSQSTTFNSCTQSDANKTVLDKNYINQSFDGLTQQLDWEQKLMKKSAQQRTHQAKSNTNEMNAAKDLSISESLQTLIQQLDLEKLPVEESCELKSQQANTKNIISKPIENKIRLKSPSPQVSIKKEFFDNLYKNQNSKCDTSILKERGSPDVNSSYNKKKYKAVRSLSQNISSLMADDPSFILDNKTVIKSSETDNCISHTASLLKTCPQYYEKRVAANSLQNCSEKKDLAQSKIFNKTVDMPPKKCEEIRNIRVSMDTNILPNANADAGKYSRLSSAVSSQTISKPQEHSQEMRLSSKEEQNTVLDETGLEKLLNSLLGEVPENQESSLLRSPPTPSTNPTGIFDDVKGKRTFLPLKMDVCPSSKANSKVSGADFQMKHDDQEQNSSKVNNFRQNNNALTNQSSFIPVYTKKANICHNFQRDDKKFYKRANSPETSKAMRSLHSPPLRQKFQPDQNEMSPGKTWIMNTRRRSVGFEDMTSLASRYGCNLSNSQRNSEGLNCFTESRSTALPRSLENSENGKSVFKNVHGSRSEFASRTNQNSQVAQNENNQALRTEKSSLFLKDKSAKRKSSLNRMDFLDFSSASGNIKNPNQLAQLKDSSSDEESDSKLQNPKSEFFSHTSKRKHGAVSCHLNLKATDRKIKEALSTNSMPKEIRSNPQLPKALQKSHLKLRQHRRLHAIASNLQKFSHSAGELESLTDLSETACASNKICLSAQEFDIADASSKTPQNIKKSENSIPDHSSVLQKPDSSSHISDLKLENNKSNCSSNFHEVTKLPEVEKPEECVVVPQNSVLSNHESDASHKVFGSLELNGDLDVKHIDSQSEEDLEVSQSTIKMENLDISGIKDFDIEIDHENGDGDSEHRPSSILRKTLFEDKRELHSILKQPPPDEKFSKTPPSILKHRESSEEKESWLPNDLHSILKKSASEDESCNSGLDTIRPILKVSTDEDSPSSSLKPRPILKKRTSFSEECSYACYQSNDLKPILKKKSLTLEEQPKPILKSRRKSEDTKSTLSEFISSRPRAYSADMGVKQSHETRFESLETSKRDIDKPDHHDL